MGVGVYQLSNTLCYPAFVAAWLGIYVPTFFIIVQSSTTDTSGINATSTTSTTAAPQATTAFNFLNILPQSAISIFSLGIFIGISVVVAILAEKCYERLSLRDDSSDMSEHTKEILRARILGMVFGKKIQLSSMTDKQRQIELSKKYAHLWQYKAAMRRQRRIQQTKEKKRNSIWGGLFSNKEDTKSSRPPSAKGNATRKLSKKPSVPSISESPVKESSSVKDKRQVVEDDFVAIDIKPAPAVVGQDKVEPVIGKTKQKTNSTQGTISDNDKSTAKVNEFTINVDNNENDEFDFTEVAITAQSAKQINAAKNQITPKDFNNTDNSTINREPSMHKYVRPPSSMGQGGNTAPKGGAGSKSISRPLTAGGSRPITAGAKRANAEYKAQGKSVRSDVIKKMGKI